MAEDVGAELEFEAVGCLQAPGRGHDACVVDEDVEWAMLGEFLLGEVAHGTQGGEVENGQLGLGAGRVGVQAGESVFAALPVAAGEHDLGTLAGQLQCGVVADATIRAGDDDSLAG